MKLKQRSHVEALSCDNTLDREKAPAYLASTQEYLCVLVKYARAFYPVHLLSAQASGQTLHRVTGIPHPVQLVNPLACDDPPHPRDLQVVSEHVLLISSVVSEFGEFLQTKRGDRKSLVKVAEKNLGNLQNYDNEIGTPQKPPKLLNVNDYSNWKARFEHYISYTDSSLWIPILEGYKHPTHIYLDETMPKPISKLSDEEKKAYYREMKALGSITMALTRELFHSFRGYDNSKDLWKALQKRFEE
ncbi:hypothetical protein L1987_53029 [Smallanthus sonchifolius]|uniref:Uncharacterized protein n=1 Tax=Smallanthus sonchifolius TaxID=185202 RepID=A0ACB9EU86_9ASTR|nr:hypothetical protein L1987_53029 [Smallanthus sonchifolius]